MALTQVPALLDALRSLSLLDPAQLQKISQANVADGRVLLNKLVKLNWLTAYQARLLLKDQGRDLVLGQYVLLDKVGEGGMGQVFKARHRVLGRMVALKVIRKERLTNPDNLRRFEREVRLAAQLTHPNIVAAFDADRVGDTHMLVMEYVEGITLSQQVKQSGPLPIPTACDYVRQTALGLQHAFERGVVHRDIKPSNLLLSLVPGPSSFAGAGSDVAADKGQMTRDKGPIVKILDMGLARLGDTTDETNGELTFEGQLIGTPDYIAPEQLADARNVDTRTDLYSLGCTFYYLLTGSVPFPGGSLGDKLVKHRLEYPTPVEQRRPEVPAAIAAIVARLMAKQPADRFQTPGELAAVLAGESAPPTPSPPVAIVVPPAIQQGAAPSAIPLMARVGQPPASRDRSWLTLVAAALVLLVLLTGLFLGIALYLTPPNATTAETKPLPPTSPASGDPVGPGKLFDGKTDFMDVPNERQLDPPLLTVETWFKLSVYPSDAEPRRWLVGKNGNENMPGHYSLLISGKKVGAFLHPGIKPGEKFETFSPADVVTLNRWHHVAMTFNGGVLRLFFDGFPVAATAVGRPRRPGPGPLTIGRRPDSVNGSYFAGWIDVVRLYNRALTEEEIKRHYELPDSAAAVGAPGLVRQWKF